MKRLVSLLLVFSCYVVSFGADKDKEVTEKVTVTGEVVVLKGHSRLSDIQLKEEARKDAKKKALEAFGEMFDVKEAAESTSAGDSFYSLAVSQASGEIVYFEVIEEDSKINPIRTNEVIYYCTARVTVKRGVEPDLNFTAKISGLQSVYSDGAELQFQIVPNDDAYLNVFLFVDNKTGYRLYPDFPFSTDCHESAILLEKGKKYYFPINCIYGITKDTDAPRETNRLVFVFTKKNLKYNEAETSREEIEKWISKIRNDEKKTYVMPFDIIK